MDFSRIISSVSYRLDSRYGKKPATKKQIGLVAMHMKSVGCKEDQQRYELLQKILKLKDVPESTKILTKGQAEAIIRCFESETYSQQFKDYIAGQITQGEQYE